jgi:hypothetical protein
VFEQTPSALADSKFEEARSLIRHLTLSPRSAQSNEKCEMHIMAQRKSLLDQAQNKATKVAKKGAAEVKSVATDALTAAAGAAAAAAGGVVLERMAAALQSGKEKVEQAKPAAQQLAGDRGTAPKKSKKAGKKTQTKKAAPKTKSAAKARSAKKSKSSKKITRR